MNWFVQQLLMWVISNKVEGIATKMWVSNTVAKQAVALAVPLIITYLFKNSSSEEGKVWLDKALVEHGQEVDQNPNDIDLSDGLKMIGHIFWSDKTQVVDELSQKTGLKPDQATDMMGLLSKYVMWNMGKVKQESWLDADGIVWLLWWAKQVIDTPSDTNWWSGMVDSLLTMALDKDKDGSYKDDLLSQGAQLLMWKLFGGGKS